MLNPFGSIDSDSSSLKILDRLKKPALPVEAYARSGDADAPFGDHYPRRSARSASSAFHSSYVIRG
jgi:hypothetical protein